MIIPDILFALKWWVLFLLIGTAFLQLTFSVFKNFYDYGYIFSKLLGLAIFSYLIYILGIAHLFSFTRANLIIIFIFLFTINALLILISFRQIFVLIKSCWKIFLFYEALFLSALFFWSFIRAHQPDIHGIEKFMDFAFVNSIVRSDYFPPKDTWLTPLFINYYYFGHFITALLTKFSNLPSHVTYNLMIASTFSFSFTATFSLISNLIIFFNKKMNKRILAGSFIGALLLTLGGNLQTIYALFQPVNSEYPTAFWQLIFAPQAFPNNYWYPNATRFIYHTIHEFPSYAFILSDLHGHLLDTPFVLLTISVLVALFCKPTDKDIKKEKSLFLIRFCLILSFLLGIVYMTNAWDGIIYLLLTTIIIFTVRLKSTINFAQNKSIKYCVLSIMRNKKYILHATCYVLFIAAGFFLFSLPFNLNFKPFASGVGILCAPKFLTDIGSFGPFLFEADHCQRSPLWQLVILYGFFYFWVALFGVFIFSKIKSKHFIPTPSDIFVGIIIALSTFLIIVPEFIYVKDIYPGHYRANTMFKLAYQTFIMLSLSSGYIITTLILNPPKLNYKSVTLLLISCIGFFLVGVYPYLAINSYYNGLKTYYGLDGIKYLQDLYPTDYQAIFWINQNIKGQPVILEAQGDSYSDYSRISTNTGLPTVLGWTVHEWLWRGTYDIPAPRIAEIAKMYESDDFEETRILLKKYNVSLIFIGDLERQKYPKLNEKKFQSLGKIIYQKGSTRIFEVNIK